MIVRNLKIPLIAPLIDQIPLTIDTASYILPFANYTLSCEAVIQSGGSVLACASEGSRGKRTALGYLHILDSDRRLNVHNVRVARTSPLERGKGSVNI